MRKRIDAHIKIAVIVCCIAFLALTFLVSGIPKLPAPRMDALGSSVATLLASPDAAAQTTASEGLLLLFYLIAAVVVAYCLVGLIDSCLFYLHDPEMYRIKSYLRKGAYHGYSQRRICRRLVEQGWDQEKVEKAQEQVFAKR